ncbi:MAG TPA: potassium channel family protein [Gemmatimonadales bacterium]|jgi:ion channel|nr:potassium channel family protein [Gemmatimonadales bacterium]
MPRFPSRAASRAITQRLLHVWRVAVLCATITHEREHPALAILILVPLNHLLFNLTASLDPSATGPATRSNPRPWLVPAAKVLAVYLLATGGLVWWYGSFGALRADMRTFSATWEWWALVFTVVGLTVLYRPLMAALGHLVGVTGLKDSRLWSALGLAVAVWVWCDGVFAALYQQLSLLCERSGGSLCQGERTFSQSLVRFVDAAYFSTITLSTAGYGDIVPVSDLAKVLVSVEIIVGFGLLGFLLSRVAGFTTGSPSKSDQLPGPEPT